MADTTQKVLQVENAVVKFGPDTARPVLDHVSLNIGRGEFVAVVGESGSGKSTLIRTILDLLPEGARFIDGRISLDGQNVLTLQHSRLEALRGRQITYVPQDPVGSLNPALTIFTQIREVFSILGWRMTEAEQRERAEALLEEVGIHEPARRLRQYPHELSGGQKQRILLAMAFAANPQLLIADEPTSGLDAIVQMRVMSVLDRLSVAHGTAVLFVTHDIGLAVDHAQRILVMQSGRIVDELSADDLRAGRIFHPYTRKLVDYGLSRERPERPHKPAGGAESAIVVKGLEKVYPGARGNANTVLQDVSFEIETGSTLALVGESGAGKSTLARILLGLTSPTSGSVRVLGQELANIGKSDRKAHWRRIQFVFQNPDSALDPRATVQTIVEEPLRASGLPLMRGGRSRAVEIIERVGLDKSYLKRKPRQLSGGQRQRVAIARALMLEAPILILDEPLSALDVVTREQILDLLRELQLKFDLTFVVVSHDLPTVRSIADRVVVLRGGELVEQGLTEDVFSAPAHEYTAQLIAAAPGLSFQKSITAVASSKGVIAASALTGRALT